MMGRMWIVSDEESVSCLGYEGTDTSELEFCESCVDRFTQFFVTFRWPKMFLSH